MLQSMIIAIVHTFFAELVRRMLGAQGAVPASRQVVQYAAFMAALSIPLLLRSEFGLLTPAWWIGGLAAAALLVTAKLAHHSRYWSLTTLALVVDLALFSTFFTSAGPMVAAGLAIVVQLALAVILRKPRGAS